MWKGIKSLGYHLFFEISWKCKLVKIDFCRPRYQRNFDLTSSLCQIVSPQKINGLSIYSPNITCNVRFRLRKKQTKPKYILVAYWEQSWGCEGTKRGEGYKYLSSFLAGLYPMSHIQLFILHRGLSQAISQCFILRYLFKATGLG